jgi:hypothetical protein
VTITFLLTVILFSSDTKQYLNRLSVILIIISIFYFSYSFEPRKLSQENIAVKQVGEYLTEPEFSGKKIYMTSQMTSPIVLFGDISSERKKNFIHLNSENLSKAEKGDLVIWDSHYGYRPEYSNDVKIESFENNPEYKKLNQFISGDKKYVAYIFEKIN